MTKVKMQTIYGTIAQSFRYVVRGCPAAGVYCATCGIVMDDDVDVMHLHLAETHGIDK